MMGSASRPRFVVVYQDRRVPLPDGEFVVGRGLDCHIRFNAPEVSRQHLKLMVRRGRLFAENMSGTTGTLVNGRRMLGQTTLAHGDHLKLGPRRLRIEVEEVSTEIPLGAAGDADPDAVGDDEVTRPGDLTEALAGFASAAPQIEFHTCPKCRTKVDFGKSECGRCGYVWADTHPSSLTSRVTLREIEAQERPMRADVPVVYASDELTLDAIVADLEVTRAFVPSPLLDPNSTTCELTLLPDGVHAMTVAGIVRSVRSTADAKGPAGMEVQFTDVPPDARVWIERWRQARR